MKSWRFIFRLVVGLVWLYEGLWLKIVRPDAHELDITSHFSFLFWQGAALMQVIGALETLLALGFWSGLFPRFVAWTGIVALLAMNLVGILASGEIQNPVGLLIHNGPLWACMAFLALGPRDENS